MKVILVDNYDRENQSDTLVCTCENEKWAEKIKDLLNKSVDPNGPDYFMAVPDNRKLFIYEP